MKIVTSGVGGGDPDFVGMMVEQPVRLQSVVSCFVISVYIVQILLDNWSFLERRCLRRQSDRRLDINLTKDPLPL